MDYKNLMTNNDSDVFIPLVPSVLGAMLMSKVSRQKEGFREDLIKMVEEDMINLPKQDQLSHFKNSVVVANGFMEKWGINYGHSSIKELDTLQMCIENKSRWFTEILETVLPSRYMSYIEYSLRYNPPKSYYTPKELDSNIELKNAYIAFCDECFNVYNRIYEHFLIILTERYPNLSDREVKLKAFENARNALPLSTLANMGMQSNLRAFCDALSELLSYEGLNSEVLETANLMKREAEKVSIGMVKHAEPTNYLRSLVSSYYTRDHFSNAYNIYDEPVVAVSEQIIGDIESLKRFGDLTKMSRFDRLPNTFRAIGKNCSVIMSEACHHQFIRHRSFDFVTYMPDVAYGIIMPLEVSKNPIHPNAKANASNKHVSIIRDELKELYDKSCVMYEKLYSAGFKTLAPYVVLNCNARKIDFFGNIFAMTNFITLRKEAHSQDEIRIVANKLDNEFKIFEEKIPGLKIDKN